MAFYSKCEEIRIKKRKEEKKERARTRELIWIISSCYNKREEWRQLANVNSLNRSEKFLNRFPQFLSSFPFNFLTSRRKIYHPRSIKNRFKKEKRIIKINSQLSVHNEKFIWKVLKFLLCIIHNHFFTCLYHESRENVNEIFNQERTPHFYNFSDGFTFPN